MSSGESCEKVWAWEKEWEIEWERERVWDGDRDSVRERERVSERGWERVGEWESENLYGQLKSPLLFFKKCLFFEFFDVLGFFDWFIFSDLECFGTVQMAKITPPGY